MTTCPRADAGAWFNYPFLTRKERDNETGLDYFFARYYSSTQGRFTSPDPLGGHTEDPQTVVTNGSASGWSELTELEAWTAASGGGSSPAQIHWLVADQLGTPRMVFDQTGALATTKRHDYLPFGEELFAGTGGRTAGQGYSGDSVRQKFTSYERDAETNLDFAEARYYANTQGRFTSVDPLMASAEIVNPQSFNRYSYVLNSPSNNTDPSGMFSMLQPSTCGIACVLALTQCGKISRNDCQPDFEPAFRGEADAHRDRTFDCSSRGR